MKSTVRFGLGLALASWSLAACGEGELQGLGADGAKADAASAAPEECVLRVTPGELDLGHVVTSTVPLSVSLRVENTGAAACGGLDIELAMSGESIVCWSLPSLEPFGSTQVEIAIEREGVGVLRGHLWMRSEGDELRVSVLGEAHPLVLELDTHRLDFGDQFFNCWSETRPVTLTNRAPVPVEVELVSPEPYPGLLRPSNVELAPFEARVVDVARFIVGSWVYRQTYGPDLSGRWRVRWRLTQGRVVERQTEPVALLATASVETSFYSWRDEYIGGLNENRGRQGMLRTRGICLNSAMGNAELFPPRDVDLLNPEIPDVYPDGSPAWVLRWDTRWNCHMVTMPSDSPHADVFPRRLRYLSWDCPDGRRWRGWE